MGGGGCGIIGSIRRVAERPRVGVIGKGAFAGVVVAADAASEFVMWGVEADM